MYSLINGSPKISNSNSSNFIKKIIRGLDNYRVLDLKNCTYIDIVNSIHESDTIVLVFPLYVDSPPSLVLKLLDFLIDNNINFIGKKVYVVANCGFKEGEQNKTAINIIKCWCRKIGAIYGCSILIGSGEIVGKKKYRLISNKALTCLERFSKIIRNKEVSVDIITTVDIINSKLYCSIANKVWTKKGKKNKLTLKDICSK